MRKIHLPHTTPQFLLYFVRQQWVKFSIVILVFILWAINDAIFPYFIKRIVNVLHDYQGPLGGVYAALKNTIILLVLFWVVTETMIRIQGILQIYLFPRFRANIRESVFEYVKSHSPEYFADQMAGNIGKKLTDLPISCQVTMEIICFQFVTAMTGSLVVLSMMWFAHPLFAGILLVWLILHLSMVALFFNYGNHLWRVHSTSVSILSGKVMDVLMNILTVRLFARAQYESQYLKKFQKDEIRKAENAMWLTEIMRTALGANGLLMILGMIFALLYGWIHQWVNLGDFTQIGMQAFWILNGIWFISHQITVFSREIGNIGASLSLIRKGHDLVDAKNAYPIVIRSGEIQFDRVSFNYKRGYPLFQGLNLSIPAGQKVGLVGFSGAGKSTFVNLILRFYDLSSGRILIDGNEIAMVTQDSLRSQISMIPQDPMLFHRTLMENIRYGRLEATDEEVIQASKLAHCHEFIEVLDDGYRTLAGERGVKLSGGQRQRIAIARAILKNAPILILDEATSALDSVTEKLIHESLEKLMKSRTTLVIAHRLSTLSNMDRILVFHQGSIIEDGTQESLLRENGHFARLWNMQSNGFLPEG